MTIAKLGDPQEMAGQERDTHEKEPPGVEGSPAGQGAGGQEIQGGVRPERAAAQLCQLKLKYEFAPQSPSKRRPDTSEQAPCSPSVETLLSATVRRVELEVAKELGPESKRSREDRTSISTDSRSERTLSQDAGGVGRTQEKDATPVAARKLANGERRSSDSVVALIPKRKDLDSPISSPITRSQVLEEDVSPKEPKLKTDAPLKWNDGVVVRSVNVKVVIPKVVITKAITASDCITTSQQATSTSVKVTVASPKATPPIALKTETPPSSETDEERQARSHSEKTPVKVLSKAKAVDVCPVSTLATASNGTCTKFLKSTGNSKEETIVSVLEPEVELKSSQGQSGLEKTPINTPTSKTRSDGALTTPGSSNGLGGGDGCFAVSTLVGDVSSSESSTPKITRTMIVTARKLDVGEDCTAVAADPISVKAEGGEVPQGGQGMITKIAGCGGSAVVVTAKRTIREVSADEVLESTPKKFASAAGTSPVATVNRRKDLDTPVLSPVMKDIPDNPSSPMTRSMSRRIEETIVPGTDSGGGRPIQSNSQTSNSMSTTTISLSSSSTSTPSSSCSSSISSCIGGGSSCGGTSTSAQTTPRAEETPISKKVRFDRVTVYLFERTQGFTSVPTQGGSTLGMGSTHQELEEYSVEEHAERRRLQLRPTSAPTPALVLPIPTKQRRELLRRSGVRDIDALEKDECESIRASRERCGCACQGRCEPVLCLCILAGISCQVEVFSQMDRSSFPCGCSRDGCDNPNGRTEFDPIKVKAHVQQTRLRANREMGLPEEQIQAMENRMEKACEYSTEGSDNSSVCSENSDYASSDEAVASHVGIESSAVLSSNVHLTSPVGQVDQAKEEPSEDSGNGGTSVDSVPA